MSKQVGMRQCRFCAGYHKKGRILSKNAFTKVLLGDKGWQPINVNFWAFWFSCVYKRLGCRALFLWSYCFSYEHSDNFSWTPLCWNAILLVREWVWPSSFLTQPVPVSNGEDYSIVHRSQPNTFLKRVETLLHVFLVLGVTNESNLTKNAHTSVLVQK